MDVFDLGLRDYVATWDFQKRLVSDRIAGKVPDTLLLVEHPHVITRGRAYRGRTVPGTPTIPVVDVDRGGDVTYHGPSQLVGYPIVHLKEAGLSLDCYLRSLEDSLIDALSGFGLRGERLPGFTGVWVEGKKVASIGVGVRRWVTYHGFALNVNTELSFFRQIYPCGLEPSTITSLERLLGRPLEMPAVKAAVTTALCRRFAALAAA